MHSFEYVDAREAFAEARQIDPDFAMAYWGEAMTHNHPVWFSQDTEAARDVLSKLDTTLEGRLAKAPTQREKDYLQGAEVLFFGDGDKNARDLSFQVAMANLAQTYPDDMDAAAFHALSILGTSHGGRDYSLYMKAAGVAEEVFARNPRHPGAAHYLIHSYDDPIHAPVGLRAARVYADIAPAASHALHMPSHIFVAMGMWDEVIASNQDSFAAEDARVERKGLGVTSRAFHALWWLTYAYQQQGRYADAMASLNEIHEDVRKSDGASVTRRHMARIRASYIVDTEQWDSEAARIEVDVDGLGTETKATDLFVVGMIALKRDDRSAATESLRALVELQDEDTDGQIATILRCELEASLLLEEGEEDEAVALLRAAAEIEDALAFDYGPPSPVKPSFEMLGETLLAAGEAAEAQAAFARALERTPKRARSLLGLAKAAAMANDHETARNANATLRQIWRKADEGVLITAKAHGVDY